MRPRPELNRAIAGMERVLINSEVSKYLCIMIADKGIVYSANCDVYAYCKFEFFCVQQSWIHEYWARKYSAFLDTRLKYSPGNAYETFPFPPSLRTSATRDALQSSIRSELEAAGKEYYEHRAALMLDLNLGLTKTYNLFHDEKLDLKEVGEALRKSGGKAAAEDCLARIQKLRELHAEMDFAVLKAYGWMDIKPEHGFYELDFLPENDRVRYTISPEARRKVLERLLELNFQRHAEELRNGAALSSGTEAEKGGDETSGDEGADFVLEGGDRPIPPPPYPALPALMDIKGILEYLANLGVQADNNRGSGGGIWVYRTKKEFGALAEHLQKSGVDVKYYPEGRKKRAGEQYEIDPGKRLA